MLLLFQRKQLYAQKPITIHRDVSKLVCYFPVQCTSIYMTYMEKLNENKQYGKVKKTCIVQNIKWSEFEIS